MDVLIATIERFPRASACLTNMFVRISRTRTSRRRPPRRYTCNTSKTNRNLSNNPCGWRVLWLIAVVDPRTGKHIFEIAKRELVVTAPPSPPVVPTVATPSATVPTPSLTTVATTDTGVDTARSSLKSSQTFKSFTRSIKKVKRTAVLTLKVGELIVTKGILSPIARRGAREWRNFNAYRERHKLERRSRTLDWFEERAKFLQQQEDM